MTLPEKILCHHAIGLSKPEVLVCGVISLTIAFTLRQVVQKLVEMEPGA